MKKLISIAAILFSHSFNIVAYAQDDRTADQLTMEEKIERAKPFHNELAESVKPFTVIGNIHSVGAKNIGIYLLTTRSGHILIDTGVSEMHDSIQENIRKLNYNPEDIKIILATHAHFDHVQGHEAMRKATGAQVIAVGKDAEALTLGEDISPLGFEGWEPVQNVKTIKHLDTVSLGELTLTAHEIPGHTDGCTVWTLPIVERGFSSEVAIFGCRGPNGIVKVKDNEQFPHLIRKAQLGYKRLLRIKPDLYLSNHPQSDWENYGEDIIAGKQPHPLFRQTPWIEMVQSLERSFEERTR